MHQPPSSPINARRRRLVAAVGAAAVAGLPAIAPAQAKRLTIVLTVPPGTSSDVLARVLGEQVKVRLNRTVIVESKPGGGGAVAVNFMRSSGADGSYVLMAPSSAVSLFPLFTRKPPFESEDLLPVCNAAAAPHGITVNAALGVSSFAEYVALVRRDDKVRSVGTPSPAGLASLLIYQIRKSLNVDLQQVPYKGGSPLLVDLLGNQIPASASIMPDYLADHRAGKLRILAIASETRSVLAPDIPTFVELGYPGLVAVTSFGLFSWKGTPTAVVNELAGAFTEALAVPSVVSRLHQMGLEPVGGTPSDYRTKLTAERNRWAPVIKETGMTVD